jgi:hypothetical protein
MICNFKTPFVLFLLSLALTACSSFRSSMATSGTAHTKPGDTLLLSAEQSPIQLTDSSVRFFKDINYGNFTDDRLDLFLPSSKQPSGLVIFIHGGGFIGGDKASGYRSSASQINNLLKKNIAYASLNYRLLGQGAHGVLDCMNDSKRALQFIRYHAKQLHIDKKSIVLMGSSAGAGTSLWIAFNNEMAEKRSPDPVLRESTRVKAVVALATQATYDVVEWPHQVFAEYEAQGMGRKTLTAMAPEALMLNFYGFKNMQEIDSEEGKAYRERIDMLKLMSSDDPEIWVENATIPYTMPKNLGALEHHPLHGKALMERAKVTHVKGTFYMPQMNIDTRNNETREAFILRKLGK